MDDARLVTELARGSREAMEQLVASVEKPLLHFILRYVGDAHTAEDLFQETFVKVIRSVADFTPHARVSTWVFTIARNLCIDHLRARKRRREVSDTAAAIVPFPGVDPSLGAEVSESMEKVQSLLDGMTAVKRDAFTLRFFGDRSYEEIAEITRAPVGTVKFRVHQAVRDIAAAFGAAKGETTHGMSGSA